MSTQRNELDVAIELTKLQVEKIPGSIKNRKDIETAFASYLSLVKYLQAQPAYDLKNLIDPELIEQVAKQNQTIDY